MHFWKRTKTSYEHLLVIEMILSQNVFALCVTSVGCKYRQHKIQWHHGGGPSKWLSQTIPAKWHVSRRTSHSDSSNRTNNSVLNCINRNLSSTRVYWTTRNARKEYIVAKYAERRYVVHREEADSGRLYDAVRSRDLTALLQLYAEGGDLSKPLTLPDGQVVIAATEWLSLHASTQRCFPWLQECIWMQ